MEPDNETEVGTPGKVIAKRQKRQWLQSKGAFVSYREIFVQRGKIPLNWKKMFFLSRPIFKQCFQEGKFNKSPGAYSSKYGKQNSGKL